MKFCEEFGEVSNNYGEKIVALQVSFSYRKFYSIKFLIKMIREILRKFLKTVK